MLIAMWVFALFFCFGIILSLYNYGFLIGEYWFAIGFLCAMGGMNCAFQRWEQAVPILLPVLVAFVACIIVRLKEHHEYRRRIEMED